MGKEWVAVVNLVDVVDEGEDVFRRDFREGCEKGQQLVQQSVTGLRPASCLKAAWPCGSRLSGNAKMQIWQSPCRHKLRDRPISLTRRIHHLA